MIQHFIRHSIMLLFLLCHGISLDAQCETIDSLLSFANNNNQITLEDRISTLEKAISITESCKDTSKAIIAIKSLSIEYRNIGDYQKSFKNFWKALLLADDSKDFEEQFNLYLLLGRGYGFLNRPEKAIEFFENAKGLIDKLELSEEQIGVRKMRLFTSYVGMYGQLNQFEKVGQYLDSCSRFSHVPMHKGNYNYLKTEEAVYLNHTGDYETALDYLFETEKFYAVANPKYLVLINTYIGDVYFSKFDYSKSEEYYLSAIELSEKSQKHVVFTPQIYDRLAKLYSTTGKYRLALNASEKSAELNFKFFDCRSSFNTSFLEVTDDFQNLKEEQKEYRQTQELQTLYQNKQLLNLQRLLLLATLFFSLIIAYFYFRWQKNRIHKEKEYNQLIEREYKLKKELSEKLATKNEELVAYSHIMSHDLKAPLNTIKSFSSLLQKQIEEKKESPRNLDYINFISSSSDSMSQLIDDLLLYSKLEGDIPDVHDIDLKKLLENVIDGFKFDINEKGANIDVQELPKVKGNDKILRTVFHNLISNGLKYQPIEKQGHTPSIKIWSSSEPLHNVIYIKDNGIGFSEDSKESLFTPFKRFHASPEYKGTGLGMSICKRIMGSHNGDIDLLETSQEGSTFKLTFPN